MSDYVLSGPKWAGQTVTWFYEGAAGFLSDIAAAFNAWDATIALDFAQAGSRQTADIIVSWIDVQEQDPEFNILGYCYYFYDHNNHFVPGMVDIFFDTKDTWVLSGGSYVWQSNSAITFYELAIHEIGHALGLDHPDNDDTAMYYDIGGSASGLTEWDIYAAQLLYGPESVPNTPPTVTVAAQTLAFGQQVNVQGLLTTHDADGNAITQYEFMDGRAEGTSARFWLPSGYQAANTVISVSAANLGNLRLEGGSAAGWETMYVRVFDGTAWSAWSNFTVTSRQPNTAPTVTVPAQTLSFGQQVNVQGLLTTHDAEGNAITQYEFMDGRAEGTSARFWLPSGYQAANTVISVSAANLANLRLEGGSAAGWETMYVRVFDGTDWSAWSSFTVTSRQPNTPPTVTVPAQTLSFGQQVNVQGLLTTHDADGNAITHYEFMDGRAEGTSARFWLPSGYQAANTVISVSAANLANLRLEGGSAAGWETMYVRVFDGTAWSAWANFTVTSRQPNTAPTVTVPAQTLGFGQQVNVQGLLTTHDADGNAITHYEFMDGRADGTSARFWLPSGYQAANTVISVSAANLANLRLEGGSAAGWETMYVRVFDGTDWSAWSSFTVTSRQANTPPTVTVAAQTLGFGQQVNVQGLLTTHDADGNAITQYEFMDGRAEGTSARFWLPSGYQAANTVISVSAANLANLKLEGGSAAGWETMYVRVFDGTAWSAWANFTVTSRQANTPPTVTVPAQTLGFGQQVNVQGLLTTHDADGNAITQYEFMDGRAEGTSARFWLPSGYQVANTVISVSAANLANLKLEGGSAAGWETMYVRVFDGTAWSAWTSFTVTSAHLNTPPTVAIAAQTLTIGEQVAVQGLLTTHDANGDAITQYEFFDGRGEANTGRFWLPSGYQAANTPIAVSAADIANLRLEGGSAAGWETMYVRVFDGAAWSEWTSFTLTTRPANSAPVATIADHTITVNQSVRVQDWLSVHDVDGDTITQYEFMDDGTGATSAYFSTPGNSHHGAGTTITVSAADLANVRIHGGQTPGSDVMWVRAFDGTEWGDWDIFTVTTQTANSAPVVSVDDFSASFNQWFRVRDMMTTHDADGDAVVSYQIWDGSAAGTSGYFWTSANGIFTAETVTTISAADMANLWIRSGQVNAAETLGIRAHDGKAWGEWEYFVLSTLGDVGETPETASTLAIGGSKQDRINWIGDRDWFAVTLEAGKTYNFGLDGESSGNGTLLDPLIRLYDSAGVELAYDDDGGLGDWDALLIYTAEVGGTFYLSAEAFLGAESEDVGTYRIWASEFVA